jgi:hypothetical protein
MIVSKQGEEVESSWVEAKEPRQNKGGLGPTKQAFDKLGSSPVGTNPLLQQVFHISNPGIWIFFR